MKHDVFSMLLSENMKEDDIEFFVAGTPQPKGSMRGFVKKGKVIITSANKKLKGWERSIKDVWHDALREKKNGWKKDGAYKVVLIFSMRPPKGRKHLEKHIIRPDVDKLARAVLDALTEEAWDDDSRVVCVNAAKRFSTPQGVYIYIERYEV